MNMKKTILYTALFIAAGALFTSCKKSVELDPTHTIGGDELTSIDDHDRIMTGAYAAMRNNALYAGVNGGSVWLSGPDIAADNFYGGSQNLGNLNTLFRWNYTADNTVTEAAWQGAYQVIRQTNLVTRGIDKYRATEPTKVNRIEGQARALRAFMHFELLRWWANDYDRNATSLGIPYVEVFDIEQMPARGTVKQTYDKIEADLKSAKTMLSNTDRSIQSTSAVTATNRAYIDSLVVNAMLARVYIYANQLDSAIKYSTLAINARPLATAAQFPQIWEDATSAELIWSFKMFAGNAALGREIYDVSADRASWLPVTALTSLYSGSDVRGPAYFRVRTGRTVLGKYWAKSTAAGNPDGVVDIKLFRTAEMYLIRAEAYARKGGLDVPALADLNALRAIRGAAVGAETGTALQTAIQTERRKELVAEGHRFFDIKRTARVINRTQNCATFCTLASTNRAWAFPIPQSEILANDNIDQNPGY
ncbi:MAG: hypothetical protein ABS85_11375 [Sphingobacteriales bacterium SCN 48-20]|jgi:hypothetical protein|nr:MAG: hypothetical protein ABS85_11375 [Sphingobacteriales bacterium SCN 48-20]OJW41996.1 MAG: hypothetical protein BGO56_04935 [Sphingobacteriales bacterium 48-107]